METRLLCNTLKTDSLLQNTHGVSTKWDNSRRLTQLQLQQWTRESVHHNEVAKFTLIG